LKKAGNTTQKSSLDDWSSILVDHPSTAVEPQNMKDGSVGKHVVLTHHMKVHTRLKSLSTSLCEGTSYAGVRWPIGAKISKPPVQQESHDSRATSQKLELQQAKRRRQRAARAARDLEKAKSLAETAAALAVANKLSLAAQKSTSPESEWTIISRNGKKVAPRVPVQSSKKAIPKLAVKLSAPGPARVNNQNPKVTSNRKIRRAALQSGRGVVPSTATLRTEFEKTQSVLASEPAAKVATASGPKPVVPEPAGPSSTSTRKTSDSPPPLMAIPPFKGPAKVKGGKPKQKM